MMNVLSYIIGNDRFGSLISKCQNVKNFNHVNVQEWINQEFPASELKGFAATRIIDLPLRMEGK